MKPATHAVTKNFAVLSAGQMLSRLLAFATTIHIAQALLPERFGAIAFATVVLLYAGLLVDFGFDAYGPIEVSRGTSPINKLVGNVVTFRSMLVIPAFIVLCVFAQLAPITPLSRTMIELYGVSLFTNALDLTWFFLGDKQMWPAVVADILTQLLMAGCAYTCIHQPEQALMMPMIFVAGRVLAVTFLIGTFVRLNKWPIFGIDWTFLRNLLAKAVPLCGSQVMSMISNNFDLLLIGVVLGTTGAGLYGAAARIVWVPTTICVAYYTALRPLVARAYTQGFDTVEKTFQRSVRVTAALSLGIATGGILLAQPIMVQMFGSKYATATGSLQVLLAAFSLMLVSRNYRLVLACFNQQPVDFRVMTAAAIVNIALNLILIKPFGITGAACATLASESLILVCDYASTRWLIKHVPLGRYVWRPLVCCAIMTSVLMLAQPIASVWPKVALGGALYIALLIAFRIVTPEEISAFVSSLSSKDKKPIGEDIRHKQTVSSVAEQ